MKTQLNLLDVVALTEEILEHNLHEGEIGTIVECYPNDCFEVEFVAQDGHTYALVTVRRDQLIALKQKKTFSDVATHLATI